MNLFHNLNYFFPALLLAVTFFYCNTKSPDVRKIKESEQREIKAAKAQLLANRRNTNYFEINSNQNDIEPITIISVKVGDSTFTSNEQGCCSLLDSIDFKAYEIPETAHSACICWWAGVGLLFFAVETLNAVNIYRKDAYEEIDPNDLKLKLVKVFDR